MKRSKIKRIATRIAILSVPVIAAALHHFYLDPFLMDIGTKEAAKFSHGVSLVIFGALIAAIAAVFED